MQIYKVTSEMIPYNNWLLIQAKKTRYMYHKKVSECDQEMSHSHTVGQPMALRGRDTEHSHNAPARLLVSSTDNC